MSRIVGARAAGFATIAGDPLTLRLARSQAVQAPTNEPPLHMIHTMRTAILAALPLAFRLFYRTGLREHMADKERQEILVKASGLDWTLALLVAGRSHLQQTVAVSG